MRAVVFTTGIPAGQKNSEFRPSALLEISGTPMIQRVIELLMEIGVRDFDFVLGEKPHDVRSFVGEGSRWGAAFRFHLSRDFSKPYRSLAALALAESETLLLAGADRLPTASASELRAAFGSAKPAALVSRLNPGEHGAEEVTWSRWAAVDAGWIGSARLDLTEEEFSARLLLDAKRIGSVIESSAPIRVSSPDDLIVANRLASENNIFTCGREVRDGVRIGRNVAVDRTVVFTPPVFLGAHSRIGPRARIGPSAWIGHNCVVAGGSSVTNSVLLSRTYIGPGLLLTDIVADGRFLLNTRLGLSTADPYGILAGAMPDSLWGLIPSRMIPCAIAAAMAFAMAPLLAVIVAWKKLSKMGALSGQEQRRWDAALEARPYLRHFVDELIPSLSAVLSGRRPLIGVSEWTAQELQMMPAPWREIYSDLPIGLVTEHFVRFGPNSRFEERAAADAYYSILQKTARDAKLMAAYALRVGGDLLPAASPRLS